MRTLHIAAVLAAALCLTSLSAEAKAPPKALTDGLQAVIDREVAAHPDIPGISLTVYSPGSGEIWSGAAGKTAIHGDVALTPDRPFRIASVTKVFVAATLLRLHEEGRLKVTDPIGRHLSPETIAQLRRAGYDPDAIRIDQVLTHSSGMADHSTTDAYVAQTIAPGGHHWTRQTQVEMLATQTKPVSLPGMAFHYSDTGYVVLGEIIERTTGQSLARAVRQQLHFRRLGLRSTWWEDLEPAPRALLPRAHQYQGAIDVTDLDPSFDLYGGGGLVSTTADLTRFMAALLRGKVFEKPQTLAMALTAPVVDLGAMGKIHGLTTFLMKFGNHLCWQHSGHWGTNLVYCPDIDMAIAYALNQNQTPLYNGLLEELAPVVDAAIAH